MWTEVGPHRVLCGSITDLSPVPQAQVVYTDPPWGEGATKMFDTLRHKAGQERVGVAWEALMERLRAVALESGAGHVMVEMGTQWAGDVQALLSRAYPRVVSYAITCTVGGKVRDAVLVHAERPAKGVPLPVTGLRGQHLILAALRATGRAGDVVLDPFAGFCGTGVAAGRLGMTFYGVEANRARLDKGIRRLRTGR